MYNNRILFIYKLYLQLINNSYLKKTILCYNIKNNKPFVMHFKENETVKDSLSKLETHFATIESRSLTTEQLLGFTRELPLLSANTLYVSSLKHAFTDLSIHFDKFENVLRNDTLSKKLKNKEISELFRHTYFDFDDNDGVIDKGHINGQLSIYKEWLDFSSKHGVNSNQNFENLKKEMEGIAVYFKKTAAIVRDLISIVDAIENSKENLRYVNILMNEFIDIYNEKVNDGNLFVSSINKHLSDYEHSLYLITQDIQLLQSAIKKKSPETMKTLAEKFCSTQIINDGSISSFLKSKEFDDIIDVRVQLKGQSRPDNILFIDGSYAYVDSGIYLHTISHRVYEQEKKYFAESIINHLSRKKPKIANFFKTFLDVESVELVIPVLDTYQQYSDVINKSGINVLQLEGKSLEAVDDIFNAVILEHKINQYVGSILSKKYEHLLTDDSRDIFKSLYESGVSKQSLQTFIGKKLAALKTPDEFFEYVEKVKIHFSSFNEESLNAKLMGVGVTPTYSKDGVVIFHVDDFDKSKKLGSVSWCIARTESYFSGYTNNGSRQYFMYDFNKKEEDNTSMIGVTLHKDGTIRASHLKNDDDFRFLDSYSQLHLEIIKNDFEHFKLTDTLSKTMKEKYNLFSEEKDTKNKKIGPSI